jgi:GDP-4-dehydro-6-deoxy-D-mannose reductase
VRALVTGGAGFAGRHLVHGLIAAGHEVLSAGLEPGSPERAAGPRWRELDVTDAAGCREVVGEARPDWVFHLAGLAQVAFCEEEPERALAVNFGGTRRVLEACAAAAPRCRVLVVSSAEVYGRVAAERLPVTEEHPLRPATAYALSKACAELARIEAGVQEPVLRVGNLAAVRDLTDVRDTVAAYLTLMEQAPAGSIYNVTSGRATSVQQLLDLLLSLCRRAVTVEIDPARLRPLDLPVFHGSSAALERDTGWRPRRELRQTLSDLLDYWRAKEPDASARR